MTKRIQAGELDVAYAQHGSGPPLVLMHGAEASGRMFDGLVPRLAEDFTVFTYDQRDCGDTEGPERPTTLLDLADDAAAFIQALGLSRVHVFGTSFGGRLAQALALRAPQVIDRLALGSTWHLRDDLADLNPDIAQMRALRADLPGTAHELARWFFPAATLEARPEWVDLFTQANAGSARSQRRARTIATPVAGSLAGLLLRTLLIAGQLDRVVPPAATWRLSEALRNSQRAVLPGVGHVPAMQAPDLLADELRRFFLSSTLPSDPKELP